MKKLLYASAVCALLSLSLALAPVRHALAAVQQSGMNLINSTFSSGAITGSTIDSTPVGSSVPASGAFTALSSASGSLNGSIGATTPSTGAFTTLAASGGFTGNVTGNVNGSIGSATPSTGQFIWLSVNGVPASFPVNEHLFGWNQQGFGEGDFIDQHGSGSGGFAWYSTASMSAPGAPVMTYENQTATFSATNISGNVAQTVSVCSTPSSGGICSTTVPLAATMLDLNYVVSCTGINPTGFPSIQGVVKGLSSVTVTVQSGTASQGVTSTYAELDCVLFGS